MSNDSNGGLRIFDQLLQSQKSRDELMKWKLIVISALGAAGLGLVESKSQTDLRLILAVIPIACVYIDLLCRNLTIRTKRINIFIATLSEEFPGNIDIKFSRFYFSIKSDIGKSLESYTLFWSTIILSAGLIVWRAFAEQKALIQWSFIFSGSAGVVLSIIIESIYRSKTRHLENYAKPHA